MIRLQLFNSILVLTALSSLVGAAAPSPEQEARQLIDSLEQRFNQQDRDGFLELCHPNIEVPSRQVLEEILKHFFAQASPPRIQWTVERIETEQQTVKVHLSTQEWHKPDQEKPTRKQELYILKPHENKLRIESMHHLVNPKRFTDQTYTAPKGLFSMEVPDGWIATNGPLELRGITVDMITLLTPDCDSGLTVGVLQLPINFGSDPTESSRKVIEADMAMAKKMSSQHTLHNQGPTEVAGKKGYRTVSTLSPKSMDGEPYPPRKRLRVYFMDEQILYFIVCDAVGPERYAQLEPVFNRVIDSFAIQENAKGLSLTEALAAQGGQGEVSDRVYTSEKFNCFIAAPDGWEISTNPDPITLVQMQYQAGKSIARIIAIPGIGDSITPAQFAQKRLKEISAIAAHAQEISHRDITLANELAYESIQTYTITGMGDFHVKEVTVIHSGTLYLILCQCISPDTFADLESDFDAIIESFGFIQ